MMTVSLIYPPSCDPTAPYLSVPTLTAWLRTHGVSVLPVDANVEAYRDLLRGRVMEKMAGKIRKTQSLLDRKPFLNHSDQMHYVRLWEVSDLLNWVPEAMDDAVKVLSDNSGKRFYRGVDYERAVQTVQAGLMIISSAYSPLSMDFTGYRTPFSLLTPQQIKTDADPEKNPFHDSFIRLCERLALNDIKLAGISMAFPGQIQPGFTLAWYLRKQIPDIHITLGGPAITQILVRQSPENQKRILGPADSAVLFEGEDALLKIAGAIAQNERPSGIIIGQTHTRMANLPPPDFDGLPLDAYFSPELVLPYDPTRGCYWGKCAFCHYGLCRQGTAVYRQRPVSAMVAHLKEMADKWGCRNFYFSQDAFLPKTARSLSTAINDAGLDIQWSTDMRPEPELTPDCCRDLKRGGALSMALGIESANSRVLKLMNKGLNPEQARNAVLNLDAAGIAVEVMVFNEFPTETADEAMATVKFIHSLKEKIALFICGRFGLWHGSDVAIHPERYGIRSIWNLEGDELGTGLFHDAVFNWSPDERERIDQAIDRLSDDWWLHDYPWAGALSTAHTLLWYAGKGPGSFRNRAGISRQVFWPRRTQNLKSRYDMRQVVARAHQQEAGIWESLIREKKAVSPALYESLAKDIPRIYPGRRRGRGRRR